MEKTEERRFVEHQIFYPHNFISFSVGHTIKPKTGFRKKITQRKSIWLPFLFIQGVKK